jgi:hypothetical protein
MGWSTISKIIQTGSKAKKAKKAKNVSAARRYAKGMEGDPKNFKADKKDSFLRKIGKLADREASKIVTEASSGVNLKFAKSGRPYVDKSAKSKTSTKVKGWAKLVGPAVVASTAKAATDKKKDKK